MTFVLRYYLHHELWTGTHIFPSFECRSILFILQINSTVHDNAQSLHSSVPTWIKFQSSLRFWIAVMQILLKIFWQSSCSSTRKLGKIQISTEQGVVCILVTVRVSVSLLVNNKSNLKCSQGWWAHFVRTPDFIVLDGCWGTISVLNWVNLQMTQEHHFSSGNEVHPAFVNLWGLFILWILEYCFSLSFASAWADYKFWVGLSSMFYLKQFSCLGKSSNARSKLEKCNWWLTNFNVFQTVHWDVELEYPISNLVCWKGI